MRPLDLRTQFRIAPSPAELTNAAYAFQGVAILKVSAEARRRQGQLTIVHPKRDTQTTNAYFCLIRDLRRAHYGIRVWLLLAIHVLGQRRKSGSGPRCDCGCGLPVVSSSRFESAVQWICRCGRPCGVPCVICRDERIVNAPPVEMKNNRQRPSARRRDSRCCSCWPRRCPSSRSRSDRSERRGCLSPLAALPSSGIAIPSARLLQVRSRRRSHFAAIRDRSAAARCSGGRRGARLIDVDRQAWFADVLERIPDYKINRIDELLPWNTAPAADPEADP